MYQNLSLYINGEFISGDGRKMQDVINPATQELLGQLPHASEADLEHALKSAQKAFETWKHSSPMDRSAILRRVAQLTRDRAQEIGRNMTLDQGKPLAEAVGEVVGCADHCDWHAEECRRIYGRVVLPRASNVRQLVLKEPIGVCVAFTPWNFPYNQAIRKIAAAIGAGCTLVLKGPEDAPSAVMAIAQMFQDAGLPPGVLNIVWGEPAKVSDYLIKSPISRKVSFTGSVPVGKLLAGLAGAHMKRVTMELGGHSPVLVFEDADIDRAATMLANFKIRNAGQVCVSPTRFYIQKSVYDKFLAKFTDVLKNIKIGNGLDAGVQMGPLAHERRIPALSRFVDDARKRGGEVVIGGEPIDGKGFFFPPTVITGLKDDAMLMTEEPFGPIAPVVPFNDIDEVLVRANSLPFGLSSYVFTNSLQTATKVSNALESGMVNINHFGSALPETPFGGVKDSGIGSEGGAETFDAYLVTKFVTHV
ncbi:succinate semialdehyde dehydrogenase [Jezberella montanilacus]|jgi:succinate-semialdehyde dehydrogenase/glutarate-semialdehyde dehydrogenase|uniref:Succinate semialdehyde dehydrogenase n=1 Tax=Jezberella montanilacus TaxID=323426 RepID=A0A2T0XHY2_9BURK|nr:NAD-dependent succinate-semialdehyde dehydrogenase [Jezberella montanilacus]PRY98517.1 succinate semialdehyde dehydrogenase [Jezberella montanilacus]|eukprot:gene2246-2284_t